VTPEVEPILRTSPVRGIDTTSHLKELTHLEVLGLRGAKVTDAGLKDIRGLASLVDLDLGDTGVTDDGLVHLKGLTNLDRLNLDGTQVTDEGLKNLQQALPKCKITHADARR